MMLYDSFRNTEPESLPASYEFNMQRYEKFLNNSIKHPVFQRLPLSLKKRKLFAQQFAMLGNFTIFAFTDRLAEAPVWG